MMTEIGRTTLLVDDYDDAIEFYAETLGFEVLYDDELEEGYRAVHVGRPERSPIGLWLMEPSGEAERALVGEQTGDQPAFVFYTDDCREIYETLSNRGVTFLGEPKSDEGGVHVHFEDPYGTKIVLVELAA
ncbi:bleomycin resistance protein [Haladaptatus sp. W1]|uniref:glyoxalase/bleomycin resistance/extradiol dioxygenase family protein n=1 Tax=Haladaptatus sp. W1 TaxID=1897478 RepID=UPI000849DCBF|nr:glyoxalase/bleomycin resistance/extradiol dioxygenase family protein [Haladaptatus sp. W1]ODR82281.1 bleomycin resistance protein [Haladaptatus sp. W1]